MSNEESLYSVNTTIGRVGACGVASERVDADGVGRVDDDGVEKVDDGGVDDGVKKLDDDNDEDDEDGDGDGKCWGFNEGAAGQNGRDRLQRALCGRLNVFARALVGGTVGKARAFRRGSPFGFNDASSDVSSILTVDSVLELVFLDLGRAPCGRWEDPRPFGFNDALSDVPSILIVDSVLELAFPDFGRAPCGRWEGPRSPFLL
jgi:hypothetical protein